MCVNSQVILLICNGVNPLTAGADFIRPLHVSLIMPRISF